MGKRKHPEALGDHNLDRFELSRLLAQQKVLLLQQVPMVDVPAGYPEFPEYAALRFFLPLGLPPMIAAGPLGARQAAPL